MEDSAHRKHWFGKSRPEVSSLSGSKGGSENGMQQHCGQVHKANTELVPANGGILAGCGFA
eukprot:11909832-Heterocapsa_arctica.AAC.1